MELIDLKISGHCIKSHRNINEKRVDCFLFKNLRCTIDERLEILSTVEQPDLNPAWNSFNILFSSLADEFSIKTPLQLISTLQSYVLSYVYMYFYVIWMSCTEYHIFLIHVTILKDHYWRIEINIWEIQLYLNTFK